MRRKERNFGDDIKNVFKEYKMTNEMKEAIAFSLKEGGLSVKLENIESEFPDIYEYQTIFGLDNLGLYSELKTKKDNLNISWKKVRKMILKDIFLKKVFHIKSKKSFIFENN